MRPETTRGGGSTHSSFFDPTTVLQSDVNYFVQIKVTSRQTNFSDLTDFAPIEGLLASDFPHVYGDSFVSGFTEGGEFSALISIKLKESYKKAEVREMLTTYLNPQVPHGSREAAASAPGGETIISMCWRGGGGPRGSMTTDWTLEALKTTIIEFPERARVCPLRLEYVALVV